jgi:hypothetical protein
MCQKNAGAAACDAEISLEVPVFFPVSRDYELAENDSLQTASSARKFFLFLTNLRFSRGASLNNHSFWIVSSLNRVLHTRRRKEL